MDTSKDLEIKTKIRLKLLAIDKMLTEDLGKEEIKELRQRIWQLLGRKEEMKSGISRPTATTKDLYRANEAYEGYSL
ncbi:uncharacterized protein Eint_081165 [Encephalitozoon intestinalis ATCC 50506]|uniref:Uncharacterized protein n=1 Tax=Encephalitozoon intestinalis (strain ATCC 50506) TaxID=876142 RepID=W8PGT6_ENCIT|nr:uncharacterized protein Eint_081165 [Encephalitozoon intestinalis ATCC 50506]AHL30141.1 hypothetical protein Eint_081165 [Encephalitozoon intestinalis ATCC 50506]UTX45838.1 hypothetical protein GPK93_08g14170 [Encephalitozoon intestinalis]